MNLAELYRKLIAAARNHPPDDRVPYSFEQRVMARLRSAPKSDEWAQWARSLWFSAGACAAIALCIGIWTMSSGGEVEVADGFSQDIEQTILASADEGDAAW